MSLRTLLLGILATLPFAVIAADSEVPVPPPGSVWAHWVHTHEELEAMVPKARPEDVATPEAIVKALHESVNGPQGPWNSDRFRSLYLPSAVMSDVTNDQGPVVISNRPMESFIKDVEDAHKTSGWYETITRMQVIKIFKHGGGFATVYYHGTASKTPGGKLEEDGDSMAILMYDGKRWWVVSNVW